MKIPNYLIPPDTRTICSSHKWICCGKNKTLNIVKFITIAPLGASNLDIMAIITNKSPTSGIWIANWQKVGLSLGLSLLTILLCFTLKLFAKQPRGPRYGWSLFNQELEEVPGGFSVSAKRLLFNSRRCLQRNQEAPAFVDWGQNVHFVKHVFHQSKPP